MGTEQVQGALSGGESPLRDSIFISYRRTDTGATAARLAEKLKRLFGEERVFFDTANIQPGEPFPERIRQALARSRVVLVVIGERWFEVVNSKWNRRRIDDPKDWVHQEVGIALRTEGVTVLPVLVDGAEQPSPDAFPEPLAPLADRQAVRLEHARFDHDLEWIASYVRKLEVEEAVSQGGEQALLNGYHRALEVEHARAPGLFREHLSTLDTVFIELEVDVEGAQRHGGGRTLRQLMEEPPRVPGRANRWVVLGHPGSGKSTLARHLVWELARAQQGAGAAALAGHLPIPVYASLPALRGEQHPFDRAEEKLRSGSTAALGVGLAKLLSKLAQRSGGVWLLLDGLDEVTAAEWAAVDAALGQWAAELPQVTIAVFSRIVGYRPLGEPYTARAQLRPLGAPDQRRLLEKWLGSEAARRVASRIAQSAALRDACQVPLTLSLLAFLSRSGGETPRGRRELFERGIQALLERGHSEGSHGVGNPGYARHLLGELSLALQDVAGDAWPVEQLEESLLDVGEKAAQRLKSWRDATDFLQDVGQRSGVLAAHDGEGAPWRFFHRQFRELLAAEALQRRGRAAVLEQARQLLPEQVPRWAEVLGFACELSKRPLELLAELGKVSEELALRVLPEIEGIDPLAALGTLAPDGEWDGDFLLRLFARWQEQGTFHRENIAGWLWSQVAPERKVPELAALHYALAQLEGGVQREKFFRACDRWPEGGPPEPEWVDIPAGDFTMGSPETEEGRFGSEIAHPVRLTAFQFSPTAVTNVEYEAFDHEHERETFDGKIPPAELGEHPVVKVAWWEAYLYCVWAGGRLPTEAEWEYACRTGEEAAYSWGSQFDPRQANTHESGLRRTVKVGALRQNAWGLYEMHGNVFEWCADWYSDYSSQPEVDPARQEERSFRVLRGGSWYHDARYARSAFRLACPPTIRGESIGFRVARRPKTIR